MDIGIPAGNARDQLLLNIENFPIALRIYPEQMTEGAPASLGDFKILDLLPGHFVWLAKGEETFTTVEYQAGLMLSQRARTSAQYVWMYDSTTLEGCYTVTVDPLVSDCIMFLNAMATLKYRCVPTDLEALERHPHPSVRLACLRYRLLRRTAHCSASH